MMQAITAAATVANARLIFADNLYMYGPVAGPITEDLPYAARGHKGRLRARMANELMAAHKGGVVRVAIGRASDFYGPNSNSLGGDFVMRPLLAGKKAMWVGNLDVPHTLTYLSDFARGLVTLGERDEALGQVWHIPSAEPLTGRQYLQMVFDEAGLPPKISVHAPGMVRLVGLFSPMVREVTETLYQFERPFVVDGRKFARAFGNAPATPHREAIKQMVAWYRQHE
jgi:nucleoside-diphosphate-sugar epimerase